MGNLFCIRRQSKTPTHFKAKKKKNIPEKVKKKDKKRLASQEKGAEKKTLRENTLEDTKTTALVNRDVEGDQKASYKRNVMGAGLFSFFSDGAAKRDTENYRNGYPGKKDRPNLKKNYEFYMNKIPSQPNGNYIDKIHVEWWGNYEHLEAHHGYIQWLFPIRESGVNWHAQELQLHEIKKIQSDENAMKRLLTSYKMMLDFYGMELENEEDGTIQRAKNWRERFSHLKRSRHNFLRITRILKCLGELGYERLKKNFIKFVLKEGLVEGTLSNLIGCCVKYWIEVLKADEDREEMIDNYVNLSSKRRDDFAVSGFDKEIEIKYVESHEMQHQNNESVLENMTEIKSGSEIYNRNDNADVQEGCEKKMADSAEVNPLSKDKESPVNDKIGTCTEGQEAKKADGIDQVEVDRDDDMTRSNVRADVRSDCRTLKQVETEKL